MRTAPIRGIVGAPLWAHALLLCLVLAAFVGITRPGYGFSSDEGAAAAQAHLLDHGSWTYDYPLSWMDGADGARPFVRGDVGSEGVAPYAKHPLYPVSLWLVGSGTVGAYGLSVVGTALSALVAAAVTRRLGAGRIAVVAALWITGMATPLLVDSGLVLAHTLAAALVATAALTTLLASAATPRRWWWAAGASLGTAALASALRTEAALAVVALAVGTVLVQRSRRSFAVGGALVVGVAAARVADALVFRSVIGTPQATPGNAVTSGLLGRWNGFYTTWLQTTYGPRTAAGTLVWLGLVALAVAALLVRRGRISTTGFAGVALVVTCAYALRFVTDPVGAVPGLVPVVPLLWTLAWLVSPRGRGRAWGSLAVASVLGAVLVIATQYSIGGGLEWGGRYFAVLVPTAVAVVVSGAAPTLAALRPSDTSGRVLVVAAALTTVLVALLGLATLRDAHGDADDLAGRIAAAADTGEGSRAVVVTPNRLLPQILHPDLDRYDWVAADGPELAGFTSQLAERVDRLVFVAPAADQWMDDRIRADWTIRSVDDSAAYDVVVLERTDDD